MSADSRKYSSSWGGISRGYRSSQDLVSAPTAAAGAAAVGVASPSLSSLSPPKQLPKTPPPTKSPQKKAWEKEHRSFLTQRSASSTPSDGKDNDTNKQSPTNNYNNNDGDDKSPSQNEYRLLPNSKWLITKKRSNSFTNKSPTPSSSNNKQSPFSLTKTKSDNDMAVRGGNVFTSLFHSSASSSNNSNNLSSSPKFRHRKTKSADALDTSRRRGQDKLHLYTNSPRVYHDSPLQTIQQASPLIQGLPLAPPLLLTKTSSTKTTSTTTTTTQPPIASQPPPPQLPSALAPKPIGGLHDALTRQSVSQNEKPKKPTIATADVATKRAFTQAHNSTNDSTSAYLGDDPSAHNNSYFALYNQMINKQLPHYHHGFSERFRSAHSISTGLSRSFPSKPVSEDLDMLRMRSSGPLLREIDGPDSWTAGKRYLIAPAALASCHISVLSVLTAGAVYGSLQDSVFGLVHLGGCMAMYLHEHQPTWSTPYFCLRQNYLLEFDSPDHRTGLPKGYCHLQRAVAGPHDFPDMLKLEFFAGPCAADDDRRVLLIRVGSPEERARWVRELNAAAKLTIGDLYEYNEKDRYGSGRYASVYPATRRRGGGGAESEHRGGDKKYGCALKIIDKDKFWERVAEQRERADTLARETSVQATLTAKCSHSSAAFLRIHSIFETSKHYVMELEFQQGGRDLFQHITQKEVLEEPEAAHITRDILTALEQMSLNGLAHRDVKPANVLMCRDGGPTTVKVCDFGMSTFVVDGLVRGRCGTPGYVAPEIFTAGVHGGYGNKVDVFSAGVTLYVMLCGYEPFYAESEADLIEANKAAIVEYPDEDWKLISIEARDLVEKMLQRDPTRRISARDALKHSWIKRHTKRRQESLSEDLVAAVSGVTLQSVDKLQEGAACILS